jgi:hypothetical protein
MKKGIRVIWILTGLLAGSVEGANDRRIDFVQENPGTDTEIIYFVNVDGNCMDSPVGHSIDYVHHTIKIAAAPTGGLICPGSAEGTLGRIVAPGSYRVEVYRYEVEPDREPELFLPEDLAFISRLEIAEPPHSGSKSAHHEEPADGSIQSGIGIIRGWACDADNIVVTVDGKELTTIYGVARGDTREKCGDTNNGYSQLVNWSLFGEGWHTMNIYYASRSGHLYRRMTDTIDFQVVTLDQPYYKDLQRSVRVPDFPHEGEYVILNWSTPDQNFKITRHRHR